MLLDRTVTVPSPRVARFVLLGAMALGCSSWRRSSSPPADDGPPQAPTSALAAALPEATLDLMDIFRESSIDSAGPVVDLGERQATAYVLSPASLPVETLNGTSWVSIGTRLRLRVPLGDDRNDVPNRIRLRIRRPGARGVAVLVDGVLVRTALLPATFDGAPTVLDLPVPSDRFARAVADVEIRFGTPRPVPGVLTPAAAQLDWVHLARRPTEPARVADLVADVAVEHEPRRALVFHPPTRLATVMVMPTAARWTASLAAEGARGGGQAPAPVTAVLRAEADGHPALEERIEIAPNHAWHESHLDLSALAGSPVRLSLAAEGPEDLRLAVAAPTLRYRGRLGAEREGSPLRPLVQHVVMVVVRGLRSDRLLPEVSPRLAGGGFARLLAQGTAAIARAPAPREFTALVSATTGLPADVHRVTEFTDTLDDEAPTLAEQLLAGGVGVEAFTDDVAWIGSGADRGVRARHGCPNDAATCKPDGMFTAAVDALSAHRGRATFTLLVTRAGLLPLDPSPEDVSALDPRPYEGTMTPSRTALYALRPRPQAVDLSPADEERLQLLYDASLRAVDRGIALLLDRIRDLNLQANTVVIVVGDRGSALGEHRTVADGPMSLASIADTVLLAWGGPFGPLRIDGVVGVVDAAATVLDLFGLPRPREFDGVSVRGGVPHDRVLPFVANNARWDLGLCFGELVALPRDGLLGLYHRLHDPLSRDDLAPSHPIARAYAEAALAALRPGAGRRVFPPATRVLPAALDALLRSRR